MEKEPKTKEIKAKAAGVSKSMQNLVPYRKGARGDRHQDIPKEELILPSGVAQINFFIEDTLTVDEQKIYSKVWNSWITQHPEYNKAEDLDDVHGIAMEKVMQYRLLRKKKSKPGSDIEKEYDTSVKRMQTFRSNLAARRTDRVVPKKHESKGVNIAVIAAGFDSNKVKKLKQADVQFIDEEIQLLEKTK